MRTTFKLLFVGLLTAIAEAQCKPHTSSDRTNSDTTNLHTTKSLTATIFDTVNEQLKSKSELMTEDLVAMKIIDTTVTTRLSETCYCDTTVQLNDSIYYSVISVNNEAGLCTYLFVASLNTKNKTVTASKFLHPDCDVDYSLDNYEIYDHKIFSKDKVQLIKKTVFQKKNRTSPDDEKNIDRKQTQKYFITITQTGQISNAK